MSEFEVVVARPWGETSYEQALSLQKSFTESARKGWLLFSCPPTITVGARITAASGQGRYRDVLVPQSQLDRLGVTCLPVDRGGQATYHGPGQIIGFPFGTLEQFTGDSRGVREFVSRLESLLKNFVAEYRNVDHTPDQRGQAGVWITDRNARRKIVAIGLGFGREGVRHGFALNVEPMSRGFELIHPCGEPGARPASLFEQSIEQQSFENTVTALSRTLAGWGALHDAKPTS